MATLHKGENDAIIIIIIITIIMIIVVVVVVGMFEGEVRCIQGFGGET